MSLLFNMLSRLVIAFLPRSKHLLMNLYLFFGEHYVYILCYIHVSTGYISNLRYADDTTLMAESKEELKSLDESEKGE